MTRRAGERYDRVSEIEPALPPALAVRTALGLYEDSLARPQGRTAVPTVLQALGGRTGVW